ncbi:protein-tyrosine-phosphatase [Bosea sp. (in: a-proteobacteria)]|uniref:tyrosine phosphatase family protein n=1 Tax=Bosea sp. (in: a-proteobacteria) TaxID=1871050 RepID=UPI00260A5098|nr:protein-tyrosine-phosphatase [Bosea sp. (in: a-proteobacteria)]MCO5091419.1 protein-tyrosine-phosphatase [Bosea sp. (in: a-proteobacteria)]
MKTLAISTLTICGIDELPGNSAREVTHVLSVLDPDRAELEAFGSYGEHHRVTLRFHDIIDPRPGQIMPAPEHVGAVLRFGEGLRETAAARAAGHLLVHCHMGISRSTAAMTALMAQADPDEHEDGLFARLREIRPQAWPNSVMIGFADEQLGRKGRLTEALRRHYAHQIAVQPRFRTWMSDLGRKREIEMAL